VIAAELPPVSKADEEEVVFVRVDIDPVEENHIQSAVEVIEKPIKRKRNLLGQILRQVIVREAGGWRNIANSNDKLTEGIHQVANTVIRTEQTVKQTLQFQ
jgi:predicted transcriptional regulator